MEKQQEEQRGKEREWADDVCTHASFCTYRSLAHCRYQTEALLNGCDCRGVICDVQHCLKVEEVTAAEMVVVEGSVA